MDEARAPRRSIDSRSSGGWDSSGRGLQPRRGEGRGAASARGGSEPLDQRLGRWVSRGRELVDGVSGARPGARPEGRVASGDSRGGAAGRGFQPARIGRWVEERLDWLLDDDGEDDWREPWQQPSPRPGRSQAGGSRRGSLERSAEAWRTQDSGAAPLPSRAPESLRGSEAVRPAERVRPLQPLDTPRSSPSPSPASAARESPSGARRRGLEAVSRRVVVRPASQPGASWQAAAAPTHASEPPEAPASSWRAAAPPPVPDDDWPDEASFSLNRWQRPLPERQPDPLQIEASRRRPDPGAGPGADPAGRTAADPGAFPTAAARPRAGLPESGRAANRPAEPPFRSAEPPWSAGRPLPRSTRRR